MVNRFTGTVGENNVFGDIGDSFIVRCRPRWPCAGRSPAQRTGRGVPRGETDNLASASGPDCAMRGFGLRANACVIGGSAWFRWGWTGEGRGVGWTPL